MVMNGSEPHIFIQNCSASLLNLDHKNQQLCPVLSVLRSTVELDQETKEAKVTFMSHRCIRMLSGCSVTHMSSFPRYWSTASYPKIARAVFLVHRLPPKHHGLCYTL